MSRENEHLWSPTFRNLDVLSARFKGHGVADELVVELPHSRDTPVELLYAQRPRELPQTKDSAAELPKTRVLLNSAILALSIARNLGCMTINNANIQPPC